MKIIELYLLIGLTWTFFIAMLNYRGGRKNLCTKEMSILLCHCLFFPLSVTLKIVNFIWIKISGKDI